jgi:hypothetical protein
MRRIVSGNRGEGDWNEDRVVSRSRCTCADLLQSLRERSTRRGSCFPFLLRTLEVKNAQLSTVCMQETQAFNVRFVAAWRGVFLSTKRQCCSGCRDGRCTTGFAKGSCRRCGRRAGRGVCCCIRSKRCCGKRAASQSQTPAFQIEALPGNAERFSGELHSAVAVAEGGLDHFAFDAK